MDLKGDGDRSERLKDYLPGLDRGDTDATRGLTIAYLDAGVEIIRRGLDHNLNSHESHPVLRAVSRPAVIREVNAAIAATRSPTDKREAGDGTFRDRWRLHRDYIGDLLVWIRRKNQRSDFPDLVAAQISAALDSASPPSKVLYNMGRANLESLFARTDFRLQLFLVAIGSSPENRSAMPDLYSHVDDRWLPFIQSALARYRLTLRPGVTEQDLLDILTAIGEGLALRELADPTSGADRARRASLQSTAALALLLACVSEDQKTLEEASDELIARHSHAG